MKSFENMKYPKFKPAIRAGMNDFPAKKQKKVTYETTMTTILTQTRMIIIHGSSICYLKNKQL